MTKHWDTVRTAVKTGQVISPVEKNWKTLSDGFLDGRLLCITPDKLNSDVGTTRKLSDSELRPFEFTIHEGSLQNRLDGTVASTRNYSSHDKEGLAAFVLACDNKIYIFNHLNKTDQVAHSSFAGKFAKGAGELMIVEGKIRLIHAHSGHYRPNALNVYQVLEYFSGLGVMAADAKVGFTAVPFPADTNPPPYAVGIPLNCLLDQQDLETVEDLTFKSEDLKLQRLELMRCTDEASFDVYRTKAMGDINEELPFYRSLDERKAKALEAQLEDLRLSTFANSHARRLLRMNNEIEDQQSLIRNIHENRRTTLNMVYDVPVFREFVRNNMATLKTKITPAFLAT